MIIDGRSRGGCANGWNCHILDDTISCLYQYYSRYKYIISQLCNDTDRTQSLCPNVKIQTQTVACCRSIYTVCRSVAVWLRVSEIVLLYAGLVRTRPREFYLMAFVRERACAGGIFLIDIFSLSFIVCFLLGCGWKEQRRTNHWGLRLFKIPAEILEDKTKQKKKKERNWGLNYVCFIAGRCYFVEARLVCVPTNSLLHLVRII